MEQRWSGREQEVPGVVLERRDCVVLEEMEKVNAAVIEYKRE